MLLVDIHILEFNSVKKKKKNVNSIKYGECKQIKSNSLEEC